MLLRKNVVNKRRLHDLHDARTACRETDPEVLAVPYLVLGVLGQRRKPDSVKAPLLRFGRKGVKYRGVARPASRNAKTALAHLFSLSNCLFSVFAVRRENLRRYTKQMLTGK